VRWAGHFRAVADGSDKDAGPGAAYIIKYSAVSAGDRVQNCSIEIVRCAQLDCVRPPIIRGHFGSISHHQKQDFWRGSQVKMVITCGNAGTPEMSSASDFY
jgi:hypothetical protein